MVIIRRTFFLKWFKKSPKNKNFWRFLAFRKASKPGDEISQGYRQFANFLIEKGNIKKPLLNNSKIDLPPNLSLWILGKNNEMEKEDSDEE